MAGFNQIVIMGKLVREPELKYVNGMPLCTMRVVVPRFYKTKEGDQKSDSLFINVTVWRRMGEICNQVLAKGSQVMVSGRLQMNEWVGRDERKRVDYQIVSERIQFIGERRQGSGGNEAEADPEAA